MNKPHYPKALTIAGSDNSGGAGIQADLRTFNHLGVYGLSVITNITAQNTKGVQQQWTLPLEMIRYQFLSLMEDMGTDIIKIGMLGTGEVVEEVSQLLLVHTNSQPIILDPILQSSSGASFLDDEGKQLLIKKLFPQVYLLTPNLMEAAMILNRPELLEIACSHLESSKSRKIIERACFDLVQLGPRNVLIKGGHGSGKESSDCLYYQDKHKGGKYHWKWFASERIKTIHSHGTGCHLSAAISAFFLSTHHDLAQSVMLAKNYLTNALVNGKDWILGEGTGPLYPFTISFTNTEKPIIFP